MADTLMTGPLEGAVFEKMSHLRYLEISENAFNSTIPELLAKLPKLSAFYAYDCGIQGELQDFLPHMKSMFELWMDDNDDLGGTIPTLIGGLTDLASLSLANNDIVGTIPSEIGKLTKMDQMWLYGNWITGTIPSEIGLLTALKIFAVEDNSIKETSMPSEVCQLDMVALSSDCGGEDDFVDCDCCTCCEAPCPIKNLPIYGNRRRR
jgi:Leucine-rich repeat (LRR) protein